jgi:dimethylhistidine N-methyltransferase
MNAAEIIAGLKSHPKQLSPKFFYDERGSRLFEKICELEEYYPTRTELKILSESVAEIAEALGAHCALFEFGSGSSTKTKILLNHLEKLSAYLPIDISRDFLHQTAKKLSEHYPTLPIIPICADFTQEITLKKISLPPHLKKVAYLSGSTLGNFLPNDAQELLRSIARLIGSGGQLLLGMDLVKDTRVLERAYNDDQGVTAEFNLNILHRIKNLFAPELEPNFFEHRAFYNSAKNRIEMHLVCRQETSITIDGQAIHFVQDETIHTENSYKYTLQSLEQLASKAGFEMLRMWTDQRAYFGVFLLETRVSAKSLELPRNSGERLPNGNLWEYLPKEPQRGYGS